MAGQMVCCLSWLGTVSELFEGPLFLHVQCILKDLRSDTDRVKAAR